MKTHAGHFTTIRKPRPKPKHPSTLIVGPWSHLGTRFPDDRYDEVEFGVDAALDMDAVHLRFFDQYLRGGISPCGISEPSEALAPWRSSL